MLRSGQELLNELLSASRVMSANGWLIATDGNFSVRTGDQSALITRAGLDKRALDESSFVDVEFSAMSGNGASTEWPLHRSLYVNRPDVNCVLHVHAPYLTAFSVARSVPSVSLLAEAKYCIGQIVLVPYREPGSRELGETAIRTSRTAGVYLLANHGVAAVGRDVKEALYRLERAEFLARVQATAGLLGGGVQLGVPLPSELGMSSSSAAR